MVSLLPLEASAPGPVTKPNPKPLLRRGTTRDASEAGIGGDGWSEPSSPTKRLRVSFNPKIDEKIMESFAPKRRSLESVRAEVKSSIEAHARGDSEGYNSIKDVFTPREDETGDDATEDEDGSADPRSYLVALTSYAQLLNKKCASLVHAILACEWVGRDEAFVRAYVHFLGSLSSAQGVYVGEVLEMLVAKFYGVRPSSIRVDSSLLLTRDQLASRVHGAMKYLLQLIPTASGIVSDILPRRYPAIDETKKVQMIYINNLLRLIEYAPVLKADVLALITTELVKIDVHMQVDLDDLDDEVAASIVHAISLDSENHKSMEGREDSDDDTNSVVSEDDSDPSRQRIKDIQISVEKMDAVLDLLFTVYSPYFADPESREARSMFDTLLAHFSNIILRNYRSRHTQFILFHFAQRSEHFVDQFAGTCVQLAFQSGQPAIFKQSAAAYLASFVARGAHVQSHIVRTVFELIGNNLDSIRVENEISCRGPDLRRYGTFYAMTQALLYIFCFRWRDLITSSDIDEDEDPLAFIEQDLEWAPGIKETFSRTIYSKLNPLKICAPPIVAEFAKIANHLRFLYVYPLLETNKRIRLSQFSLSNGVLRDAGNGGNSESWHQLDAYFPFDPYQLPVSKRWVEGDYVQWKGIPGLDEKEESEEDTSDEEDEDSEVELEDEESDE